jgi:hypothetical protein
MKRSHWIPTKDQAHLVQQVRVIQGEMGLAAAENLSTKVIEHMRALTRIVVEFNYYLQSDDHAADDLIRNYVCDSVAGANESFQYVNNAYRGFLDALPSKVDWSCNARQSLNDLKSAFRAQFEEFIVQKRFENKYRSLLDLYKLGLLYASLSYS